MVDQRIEGKLSVADSIGIGTETPNAQLHIAAGATEGKVLIESGGNLFKFLVNSTGATIGTVNPISFSLQTDGSSRLTFDAFGNVGVGKVPSNFKLDVNGVVNATGFNRGGIPWKIQTGDLDDNSVTSAKIVDQSVTTNELANSAVTTSKLAPNSVTQSVIADNAITTQKLALNAVTSNTIANNSVTSVKVGDLSITTNKLADGNVTAPKLAPNSVTTIAIADNAITTQKLALNAVTSNTIADNAVIASKIPNGSITAAKLVPGTIPASQWVSGAASSLSYTGGNSGKVGIGTATPTQLLDVAGVTKTQRLRLGDKWLLSGVGDPAANDEWLRLLNVNGPDHYGGFAAGKLWTSSGSLSGSDRRLKTEIAPIGQALSKLTQLQGVSFRWKNPLRGTEPQLGVIAQEVETVFPELVETGADGMKSVNYSGLIPVLIEALKTQQQMIIKLQTEMQSIKQVA